MDCHNRNRQAPGAPDPAPGGGNTSAPPPAPSGAGTGANTAQTLRSWLQQASEGTRNHRFAAPPRARPPPPAATATPPKPQRSPRTTPSRTRAGLRTPGSRLGNRKKSGLVNYIEETPSRRPSSSIADLVTWESSPLTGQEHVKKEAVDEDETRVGVHDGRLGDGEAFRPQRVPLKQQLLASSKGQLSLKRFRSEESISNSRPAGQGILSRSHSTTLVAHRSHSKPRDLKAVVQLQRELAGLIPSGPAPNTIMPVPPVVHLALDDHDYDLGPEPNVGTKPAEPDPWASGDDDDDDGFWSANAHLIDAVLNKVEAAHAPIPPAAGFAPPPPPPPGMIAATTATSELDMMPPPSAPPRTPSRTPTRRPDSAASQPRRVTTLRAARRQNPIPLHRFTVVYTDADLEQIHLRDHWCETHLDPGDIVHVVYARSDHDGITFPPNASEMLAGTPLVVDASQNFVIVHPDTLIPGSSASELHTCLRRSVLKDRIRGRDINAAQILGTLTHDFLQLILLQVDEARLPVGPRAANPSFAAQVERACEEAIRKRAVELYAVGMTTASAREHLMGVRDSFVQGFVVPYLAMTRAASPPVNRNAVPTNPLQADIEDVVDVEESIWSPTFGLKGKIDATVRLHAAPKPPFVRKHSGPAGGAVDGALRSQTMPSPGVHGADSRTHDRTVDWPTGTGTVRGLATLEIKTGKARGLSHRAQTLFYSLLLRDVYADAEVPPVGGLLFNSSTSDMSVMPQPFREVRDLMILRNGFASALRNMQSLPPVLGPGHAAACSRCFILDQCMVAHRSMEDAHNDSAGLEKKLWNEKTGHLSAEHMAFLRKWTRLIALEEAVEEERRARRPEDVAAAVDAAKIVATTCLSACHPLLQEIKGSPPSVEGEHMNEHRHLERRHFDVCIVDEASQIALPIALGPLSLADRILLVGDHHQLAPVVRSPEAVDGGLGVSLFEHLLEAYPRAAVSLDVQYRMNDEIMTLVNFATYHMRLQCGSEAVARQRLVLAPQSSAILAWIRQVLVGPSVNFVATANASETDLVAPTTMASKSATVALVARNPADGTINNSNNPTEGPTVGGIVNVTQVEMVRHLTACLLAHGVAPDDIGIITPYRAQLGLIRAALADLAASARSRAGPAGANGNGPSSVFSSPLRSKAGGGTEPTPSAVEDTMIEDEDLGIFMPASVAMAAADVECCTNDQYQGRDK
ncbi:hypothetical protein AMAG_01662 [Allomyces macrogynus ATCC 38327]|uniref:Uncharacterized protein n=1 Tax=Allomyces macrogynus (strain ATCC 38327) TaxID=578462 RepID=A0A0L0RZE1_ALLM3|nr:hypothetical protein AMAG_01662 [Allomyces macrogynus ATCC 38327]|eukprot:KNE55787.1 hypothetical protein AMAG_01662 [Allomyces macrogynus ATCC 38327]